MTLTPVIRPTLALTSSRGVMLVVTVRREPTDEDMAMVLNESWLHTRQKILVAADASPSATQRNSIVDYVNATGALVAVLTSSQMIRGVVTAMRWLTSADNYSAFDTDDVEAALRWLGFADERVHADVRRTIEETRRRMSVL